jgi:plastocyanin
MKSKLIVITITAGLIIYLTSCFDPDIDIPDLPQDVDTNEFIIDTYGLSPDTLYVKKGTSVGIYNFDSSVHNFTVSGDTNYQTGDLEQYESYTFYVKYSGKFRVHCTLHSEAAILYVNP